MKVLFNDLKRPSHHNILWRSMNVLRMFNRPLLRAFYGGLNTSGV